MGLHSDIGTETYFTDELNLVVYGVIPRHILDGFERVFESGIYEWWHKLIISLVVKTENPSVGPTKPSMVGNILVIFIVWLAGSGFGILVFGIEQISNLYII